MRCVYHGWKLAVDGTCVDMPNVDAVNGERMKPQVAIKAYPVREAGGVVWTNLGPKADEAVIPELEWTRLPADHVFLARWLQRSNYAQGLEGELDSAHLSFLHKGFNLGDRMTPALESVQKDGAPVLEVSETPYGMTYGARRTLGENQYHWRTTNWLLPFYSLLASAARDPGKLFTGRAWIPVDDYHVTTLHYIYRIDRPITADERADIEKGDFFPPLRDRVAYALPDGSTIDTYLPRANKRTITKSIARSRKRATSPAFAARTIRIAAYKKTWPAASASDPAKSSTARANISSPPTGPASSRAACCSNWPANCRRASNRRHPTTVRSTRCVRS